MVVFLSIDEVHLFLGGNRSAPIRRSADFLVDEGVAKEEVTSESLSPSLNGVCLFAVLDEHVCPLPLSPGGHGPHK